MGGGKSVKANLIYDITSGGYSLRFDIEKYDREGWSKLKLITGAIKGIIPASDRDYDPASKTWFFHERHFVSVKILLEHGVGKDNVFVMEKPADAGPTPTFIALDTDVSLFLNFVGVSTTDDIKEFEVAKRLYRKAAIKYHPDRNGGNGSDMSELNRLWHRLKKDFWKLEAVNA